MHGLVSIYRNWLVLLLRRLVIIYYQLPDQQKTVQAQVYTAILIEGAIGDVYRAIYMYTRALKC